MNPPDRTLLDRIRVSNNKIERKCRICNEWKDLEEYHVNLNYFMGHTHECKVCMSKYYKKRNTVEKNRVDRLKRLGLTLEDYYELYKEQEGKCKICQEYFEKESEHPHGILHVDHCHETKKVRGLLCNGCNLGIGHLNSPTLLESAIKYLKGGD